MEFLMQPIRRTVVMKEVNDNELPLEPQLYPALATGTEELPPMATGSIGGQICAADVVAGAEGDDEPQASEQSIGQIDPKTPGWSRKVRIGAVAPERAPCHGRPSALEKTIHGFTQKRGDIVIVPALGTSFDTLGEAYDFYNLYSWEKGFGIRYGKSRLNVESTKGMQETVCGCAGKAGVENSRACRCECPALIMLLRSKDNGWYIAEHHEHHSLHTSTSLSTTWADNTLAFTQAHRRLQQRLG
ncbi:uncharacterized protein [Aegilops tauschii subsp. strangulata]|uniref:FAR1 domain-containing protein n=4 Tax=Aegilops tauschii subsp. strangulata TaxID=200361 RepID=A0A453SHR7_AEGTS